MTNLTHESLLKQIEDKFSYIIESVATKPRYKAREVLGLVEGKGCVVSIRELVEPEEMGEALRTAQKHVMEYMSRVKLSDKDFLYFIKLRELMVQWHVRSPELGLRTRKVVQ